MKKIIKRVLIGLGIAAGMLIMLYPFYSNLLYNLQADGTVEAYHSDTAEAEDAAKREVILQQAYEYNRKLADGQVYISDPFADDNQDGMDTYHDMLRVDDSGVMGVIRIPCIDVSLPIYHGTSSTVLERGCGHLQGTSLPVGGTGTHAVITGHTGLSSAKMFTDLVQMETGDLFFIDVVGETLAYQVVEIFVVVPSDNSKLHIEKDKDYCTLVTCTPYGVNSHRLLVRGERIPYTSEAEEKADEEVKPVTESKWQSEYLKSLLVGGGIICMFIIFGLIFGKIRNRTQ